MAGMQPAPAPAPLDGIDDNVLSEILLRLPPQPSSLPRASAVYKRWDNIARDPGFCRRFRRHHRRSPPLLGFFDPDEFISFVPTLDAPDRVPPGRFSLLCECDDRDRYESCGSRHGLVFIFDKEDRRVLVWDPVTGDQHRLDIPPEFEEDSIIRGTVLRDPGYVHFRVVLVVGDSQDREHRGPLACVYSAETNSWGDLISMLHPPEAHMKRLPMIVADEPAVMIGDSLYWQLFGSFLGILEFNLESQSLAVIRMPADFQSNWFTVIREEGGGLGFISVSGFTARIWKRETDRGGVASWVLGRTIQLDKLLCLDPDEHKHIFVQGYAEENNLVFLSTAICLFMVQLQSSQFTFMKHSKTTNICSIHPFESVYTAETRRNGLDEFNLSEQ